MLTHELHAASELIIYRVCISESSVKKKILNNFWKSNLISAYNQQEIIGAIFVNR